MKMDWILAMVLHERKDCVPVHVKKIFKVMRVAGWRRVEPEWTCIIRDLAAAGSIRATVSDKDVPFEVFWPDARDENTAKTVDMAAGRRVSAIQVDG